MVPALAFFAPERVVGFHVGTAQRSIDERKVEAILARMSVIVTEYAPVVGPFNLVPTIRKAQPLGAD